MNVEKNEAAVLLGKLGRAVNTDAQKEASRRNGALGGRPIKYRCRRCGASGRDLVQKMGRKYLRYKCRKCGAKGTMEKKGWCDQMPIRNDSRGTG